MRGGDAAITLHVRERVAVKDRLFRLAAADVGELGRDLVNGRVALRPIELAMRLSGAEGAPAELTVTDLRRGESRSRSRRRSRWPRRGRPP